MSLLRAMSGLVLVLVPLVACGPGVGPGGDAEADATGAGDAGLEIAPPDIPWLDDGMPPIAEPMLTPCPERWHEVIEVDPGGEMDVVTCDPYGTEPGGTEPDVCPEGEAHFTGDLGCTPVGAPCPEGDFPEGLPSDGNVVYARRCPAGGRWDRDVASLDHYRGPRPGLARHHRRHRQGGVRRGPATSARA